MPPTPNNFIINPDQVNIQAPKVQEQIAGATFVKEGEVSMAAPREMIGGIDTSAFDWYGVGAKAFEVAGNILPRVLEYNIQKKGAEISDIIYDAETKVYDSYSNKKQQGLPSDFASDDAVNGINNIQDGFYKQQNEAAEKINSVFEFENPLFVKDANGNYKSNESFKYDGFGSRWFDVIDNARRGYKSLAEAGERVQRDALLTMNEQMNLANAFNNGKLGKIQPTDAQKKYNQVVDQNEPGLKQILLPKEQADLLQDKSLIIQQDPNTGITLVDNNRFMELPEDIRKQQYAQYVQEYYPQAGIQVPDQFKRLATALASAPSLGTENPKTFDMFYHIAPQISDESFEYMQTQDSNISEEGMNRLRIIRYLSRNTNKSSGEVLQLVSKTNLETMGALTKAMSTRTSLSQQAGVSGIGSKYTSLENSYSSFFIDQLKTSGLNITQDNLNQTLRENRDIREAYMSGLSFYITPDQELNKDEREKVSQNIIVSSLLTPSTYTIKGVDANNNPRFTRTGLVSPNSIFRPEPTKRTLQQLKQNQLLPKSIKESLNDGSTGELKLGYASQLAMTNLEGDVSGYTGVIASSIDESFFQQRTLFPVDKLQRLVSTIRIERTNPSTGQTYDAGPNKATIYKLAFASSDQVLTKFNGGVRPQTEEEIQRSFYAAMEAIPTADQWGWTPNLSESKGAYRNKTMGEARVDMVLTSIPLYNKDGVGELLTDSTVIPIEMKNGRSFINPVNGQSMSFFSDIKDESGAIDIYGPASDFNVWANSLQSGTNPNQIKLTTSPKTVQNQIDYFVAPKTKDELVGEIKDSLLKTPNRNTSKDSIFVGQDSSMDTIAEFRMALQSEMPFLVKNAQQNMGLNQQQAVELYSALLTDETSAALFEKAKGKQFIVTLADVTLSTKQFLNNAQTNVPNLPPIDSSNNDILKGIQDRITITPTKLMAQAIEQAEIKKQETTPQTKMEWNYDTLSWEKVPVVKEQTFTSDPNFKYGGAIGMIRDFFTGEKTQKETSPGSVGEKPYINLISEFEGMKTEAYWDDTGKVWTIGKGTTTYRNGTPVKKGDKISKEEADNLMQDFVDTKIIPRLSETIPTWNEMNPNQQAALISFAYNMKNGQNFYGRKGFETLTKAVSSVDNFKDVPTALLLYNKTGGKKSKGLARRRKAEADLWSK